MIDQSKIQQKSRLGSILVSRQYISQAQLDEALVFQATNQVRLGEALLTLGFIDQKQLKRALRRQNWVRGAAAGVALVLAPFSPAFAASQGVSGKTSSASSQISVTILPKTLLNGESSLAVNQGKSSISNPLCLANLAEDNAGAFMYSVQAEGSGKNGAFELSDKENNRVSYQVAFQHQGKGFETLTASKSSKEYQIKNLSKFACSPSALSQLKVSMKNSDTFAESKLPSTEPLSGTLTLTIAAE